MLEEFQLTFIAIFFSYMVIGLRYVYLKEQSNHLSYKNLFLWLVAPAVILYFISKKITIPSWLAFIVFVPCFLVILIGTLIFKTLPNPLEFE